MATIALALICKNEVNNLPQLLKSVAGCFDEIHVTDTGSTDGTLQLLDSYKNVNPSGSPLFIHNFEWVNDFAAARNASFKPITTDFIMWMDCDDILSDRDAFLRFKENVMPTADYWLATYHYGGIKEDGSSPCKFMRERVIRNGLCFTWNYFVHEGIRPDTANRPPLVHYVTSWAVIHMRTAEDQLKDRRRNINMFAGRGKLDARMRYYYGKELFENGQPMEAFSELVSAISEPELEGHDRIMGMQLACLAAMQCNQPEKAIQIAHQGLQLMPARAEFHVTIADCLVKLKKPADAIPFYRAAKTCDRADESLYAGAIFSHAEAYGHYPLNQLARCYFHTGKMEAAKAVLNEAMKLGPNLESVQLLQELEKIAVHTTVRDASTYKQVQEIAITCVPNPIKGWDEDTLSKNGIGGSETAVIHMARKLHDLTGLRVRVFNDREATWERDGVTYEPLAQMYAYFKERMPLVQIAWRHNIRLCPAPMYIWCHDLLFLGLEMGHGYDHVFALSDFHKDWLHSLYGVPLGKIIVTRNGIDAERYNPTKPIPNKVPHKVIFSSSPDRGMDTTIKIMDLVRLEVRDAELHCYYGFEGMLSAGKQAEVQALEQMIKERPWVHMHGNIKQSELTQEFHTATVWLYPTNFLETFCITALEALCAQVYPVVRKYGALPDTLRKADEKGMADILDIDPTTPIGMEVFATAVVDALKGEAWRRITVIPEDLSWESVAREWIQLFGLTM